ncbi:MAG TPA: DUF2156 domain-containing protein [Desulfobulbaceae bacterium]|nr:DUF2156 domain-containing protein [Desulfobulbaceae bacterium]
MNDSAGSKEKAGSWKNPDMIETKILNIEHQALIKDFFARFPPEISEHTFTNLFVWSNSRPVYFAEKENSLLVFIDAQDAPRPATILFGPPVGGLPISEVVAMMGDSLEGAIRLPAEPASELTDAGYALQPDRDNADYVYLVEDLARLSGRHYAKKRNQIKKCLKAHSCAYESITADLVPQCIALQQRWCTSRSCDTEPGLCAEYTAILTMFEHFFELDLIGGAIRVNGEIQAFAIGEQLNPETAVCHFEKALPGMQGLGQLINQWFALYGLTGFTFVNREQDMGVPGLRQAKKSYHPHHLVKKYTLSLTGNEPVCTTGFPGCVDELG